MQLVFEGEMGWIIVDSVIALFLDGVGFVCHW